MRNHLINLSRAWIQVKISHARSGGAPANWTHSILAIGQSLEPWLIASLVDAMDPRFLKLSVAW